MAKKLTGMLNLSKIPRGLIFKNKNGDSCVWIDVVEKRAQDKYLNTHTVSIYDKNARQAIYLADLKPEDFGTPQAAPAPAPANGYRQTSTAQPVQESAPANAEFDENDLPFA